MELFVPVANDKLSGESQTLKFEGNQRDGDSQSKAILLTILGR
jgi:hypothetical protein